MERNEEMKTKKVIIQLSFLYAVNASVSISYEMKCNI